MSQLQDRVASMVHAFPDRRRREGVRALAWDVGALEARLAALEAEAKQAREDEEWAEAHDVGIDSEPVEKGWHAVVVIGAYPLMDIIWANGPTTHAALRALRAKVEGGTQ